MILLNFKKLRPPALIGAALLAALAIPASADVQNGKFLSGGTGYFSTIGAGTTFAGDWYVVSGSVDWIGSYWAGPPNGGSSVDLDGNSVGSISQSVITTPNQSYTLNFWLNANPDGAPQTKVLFVTAGGTTPTSQTYNKLESASEQTFAANWSPESLSFTATGSTTLISFASEDPAFPGYYGPVIGDVSLVATPEPGFYGILLLGLAGLALAVRRRRLA